MAAVSPAAPSPSTRRRSRSGRRGVTGTAYSNHGQNACNLARPQRYPRGLPTPTVHELDGSDGGGQPLRTALALSALTGEPFRMEGVREHRPQPGLKPQHLAAVRAVGRACDAEVEGATVESRGVEFAPGELRGGTVSVDVDTAGSVALVFDAALPVAYALPAPLHVRATGGTHVRWAPTMEHYRHAKLPLLAGVDAAAWVDRVGFHPPGGGEATLALGPSAPKRLELLDRGSLRRLSIRSLASEGLAGAEVAERQADTALEALTGEVDAPVSRSVEYVASDSPGSALVLVAEYDRGRAGFDALGERGRPAEDVAREVLEAFSRFRDGGGAVDRHTADQLMVPLAVGGGAVRIPEVTDHVTSNAGVIRAFGGDVEVVDGEEPRLISKGGLGR